MRHRLGWALTGALALTAVLALARATVAGPLDPPGPVASTMRTVDELLPSWGKTLSSTGGCTSQRFTCVLGNAAVLDHETGLVWQRVPSATSIDFLTADQTCREAKIGGRYGWRLPAIDELLSLDDDTTPIACRRVIHSRIRPTRIYGVRHLIRPIHSACRR